MSATDYLENQGISIKSLRNHTTYFSTFLKYFFLKSQQITTFMQVTQLMFKI